MRCGRKSRPGSRPRRWTQLLGPAEGDADRIARAWLSAAGKRWRPFLTACAYKALQDDPDAAAARQRCGASPWPSSASTKRRWSTTTSKIRTSIATARDAARRARRRGRAQRRRSADRRRLSAAGRVRRAASRVRGAGARRRRRASRALPRPGHRALVDAASGRAHRRPGARYFPPQDVAGVPSGAERRRDPGGRDGGDARGAAPSTATRSAWPIRSATTSTTSPGPKTRRRASRRRRSCSRWRAIGRRRPAPTR